MIAVAAIGIAVSGIYWGLLKVNDYAEAKRLNSCATAMVLAQIDKALSVRPFYPLPQPLIAGDPFDDTRNKSITSGISGVPAGMMVTHAVGTATTGTMGIFLDADALASGSSAASSAVVTGTLTTVVNEADVTTGAATANLATTGTSVLRRINVNLSYQHNSRSYNIQMTALRAPDQ